MKTIDRLRAAFMRLKINEPEVVLKDSKVSVTKVVIEAGFKIGTVSEKKHGELYHEINEYKGKLNKLKAQDETLKSDSKESKLREQLKSEKKLKEKYYSELQEGKDKLTQQRAKDSMVLQAMFELLNNDDKEAILHAGADKVNKKVIEFSEIKKQKLEI